MNQNMKPGSSSQGCTLFQSFTELQKIGSGAFGLVLKAKKNGGKSWSAIKLIPFDNRRSWTETSEEARKVFRMSPHDSVVSCLSFWRDEFSRPEHLRFTRTVRPKEDEPFYHVQGNGNNCKFLCIEMELCGNGDLRTWLKRRKQFSLTDCTSIFLQIARGLEHIHAHKLIHRDLKPENVLFNGKIAKITDFGLSVTHNPGQYNHTARVGTVWYQAPEQALGRYGQSADYYALGLILFELFHPPAQNNIGEALLHLKYNKKIPARVAEKYPIIANLIERLTSITPTDRPTCENIMKMMEVMLDLLVIPDGGAEKQNIGEHCTHCRNRLSGVRYKCVKCPDVVLCETCEDTNENNIHPDTHNLLKIKRAAPVENDLNGCQHYRRKCKLKCPTPECERFFYCRFCHDDNVKGHKLDRFAVDVIQCTTCNLKQSPRRVCLMCKTEFAEYCCTTCNLYDDSEDANKLIFHCPTCGICRKRTNEFTEYSHCDQCSMCYPKYLRQDDGNRLQFPEHECQKNAGLAPCTVCDKDIHKSRDPGVLADCHHYVHKSCREDFPEGQTKCPVCGHW